MRDLTSAACTIVLGLSALALAVVVFLGSLLVMLIGAMICVPLVVSTAVVLAMWGKYGSGPRVEGNQGIGRLQQGHDRHTVRFVPIFRESKQLSKSGWPDQP